MKVLVTGGCGFMGSHLVDYLIEKNHDVTIIDNMSSNMEHINPNAVLVKGDLRDQKLVNKVFGSGFDVVYHLAAWACEGASHYKKHFLYDNNLLGSITLLNAAVNTGVKRLVFASSMAVYGPGVVPFDERLKPNPIDSYAIAKYAFENELKISNGVFGLDYVIIRPHNIIGPRQNINDPLRNVLTIWINRILHNNRPLIYGDGMQLRAFSYIDDITPPLARAGWVKKASKEIINLGSDEVVTINKACNFVLDAMASNLKPKYVEERSNEVKLAYCTTQKSKDILSYETKTSLKEGIKRTVEWASSLKGLKLPKKQKFEITKNLPKYWR